MNKKCVLIVCLFFLPYLFGSAANLFFVPLENAALYMPKIPFVLSIESLVAMGRFFKNKIPSPRLTEVLKPEISEKINATEKALSIVRDNTNNFLVGDSAQDTVDLMHTQLADGIDSMVMNFFNFAGINAGEGKVSIYAQATEVAKEAMGGIVEPAHDILLLYKSVDLPTGVPVAGATLDLPASNSRVISNFSGESLYTIMASYRFVIAGVGLASILIGYCMYKKINPFFLLGRIHRSDTPKKKKKLPYFTKNAFSNLVV